MEAKIVAIGNSQGLRLPKAVLRRYRLSQGQSVQLDLGERGITIIPSRAARQGWDEAFAKARKAGSKEDLWGDIPVDEAWDD